jgi:hypothetical protein
VITKEYIENFKRTETFKIVSRGFLSGKSRETILGENEFRLSTQYDNSILNTTPTLVIITAHILIKEGKLDANIFEHFFENRETCATCLLLEYIFGLVIYGENNNEIKVDLNKTFSLLKNEKWFDSTKCNPLFEKIERLLE